jgi:hypothetical protein
MIYTQNLYYEKRRRRPLGMPSFFSSAALDKDKNNCLNSAQQGKERAAALDF